MRTVHNMAGHWHCGDVSSNMRDNHSRQPFRLHLQVQNQGLAPGVKAPLTFDPAGGRRSVRATQSWSPVRPISPPVPLRQRERRVKQVENHASVRDLEEDEGYFSPFNRDFNGCTKPSRSVFYGSSSSPLLSPRKTRSQPGRSRSGCHERTPLCRQDKLLAADDLGLVASGSVCGRVALKVNYGSEQNRQVSMEVQEHTWEPVHGRWTKLVERDAPPHASYEAASPLQLKVKSVVVVPGQLTNPSGNPPQRTFFVDQRGVDWECEKRCYLESVKKHISWNRAGSQGVMTELLDLMSETTRSSGSRASQPQHPSDLTRRNYQGRLPYAVPSLTLRDWQLSNCQAGKRFANVSNHFRSHSGYF